MENKEEDAIRKRWEQEAREKSEREDAMAAARPRKRLREIEYKAVGADGDVRASNVRLIESGILTPEEGDTASEAGESRARGRGRKKGQAAGRVTRAKGKVMDIPEDDEEYIELD